MKKHFDSYQQATEFLFGQLAVFQRDGGAAYKPGLDTARALDSAFGNPHGSYATIHIAGTNGKGSTAHTLAAILQSAGYRTGLYTSPHLVDFRERMRIDGAMIPESEVVDFVNRYLDMDLPVRPSFFELTMTMAFEFFKRGNVDIAVIETGLGGRLDSTNIISPVVSVITNISYDHTQFLGDTLEAIASEKAGIIKPGVPVVVGEATGGVRGVFEQAAQQAGAPVVFAQDMNEIESVAGDAGGTPHYTTRTFGSFAGQLSGEWQHSNAATVLEAVKMLRSAGFDIPDDAVAKGFAHVCGLTGLAGRWMVVGKNPLTVCDTGHNTGGWQLLAPRLDAIPGIKRMVIGFVNDKDIRGVLRLMKGICDTVFYFAKASVNRALDSQELAGIACSEGIEGLAFPTVESAYRQAAADASPEDTIFIGGSTFIVADFLASLNSSCND
ncbi:MAG: bifunctional folylpolyglutamate synthase/dihydrofolate synthase [Muribaculaceae bacterium]|nr:bifunctional folylpolyglutamate synthase/dihydrofolate synthase [Muribaculaceae bacterium]